MTGDNVIHEQMIGEDKDSGAISALSIIYAELMETIRNAHLALEDCVDGRGGTAALRRAGELLHQAGGALRLTETYGAALLIVRAEGLDRGARPGTARALRQGEAQPGEAFGVGIHTSPSHDRPPWSHPA